MGAAQGTGVSSRRTLVVACGALSRELLHLVEVNGLDHIDVECLPASYHNEPDRIPEAVAERVRAAANSYDRIFVGYADCGTGGRLDSVCESLGVERLPGAHCYEFFTGGAAFAKLQDAEIGSFYLTDFLVRHFNRLVIEALWLDSHPELLDDYFGNYTRLVYLAQVEDHELETRARAAAERLGLTFEMRRTGYGDLELAVVGLGDRLTPTRAVVQSGAC
ncbi:MAG: DUF1638 domain-containing protein [Actinomycetota bacterium]|nr:DUF1638 domain-containing protein [Actinomycetota bacterium]